MRRIVLCFFALLPAMLGLAACATEPAQNHVVLKVAVADNFAPVMRDLAMAYHRHQPWVDIELTEANTARLEQDLKEGKAFDIYLPSQSTSMEALARKDAVNPLSRQLLALNQLVVIAPLDSKLSLDYKELTDASVRQIAVANPNSLLGHLTRQALTNVRMLPSHEATVAAQPNATPNGNPALPGLASLAAAQTTNLEPKLLVLAKDSEVVDAVADGRAQVGITYASFVVNDKKVRILGPLELGTYDTTAVAYNVAIPRNAPHNDEAWQFLNYLRSAEAHAIMQRDGLLVN